MRLNPLELAPVMLKIKGMTETGTDKQKAEPSNGKEARILEMQRLRHEIMERRKRRVRSIQERHC
jgi:hypothetical protein